ncbi:arylsulfotransferase family protein [Streptomyces sp. NPDC093111]|uniref:arylsulfotransferase family protein n=1 Tax=Streptomyces sp. NPDC093111 TaxID=3154978 RepID=UPI003439340A
MPMPSTSRPTKSGEMFLFSPSSSYPRPFACVVDTEARLVHAWSSPIGQADPETNPPTWLRGWNHVELGPDGHLYAMVPLHCLIKLAPDSTLVWQAHLPVHHDLDFARSGEIYVLTEEPRAVTSRGQGHVLLDNTVTVLGPDGQVRAAHSLYDLLSTVPLLLALVDDVIEQHRAAGHTAVPGALAPRLTRGEVWARGRDVSLFLRTRPGSPSDVLHTNTVEVLDAHPHGLWAAGDVLVSFRNLDLIAVLDLRHHEVRWWWGPGELSGQHQPSALPGGNVLVFDNGRAHGRSRVVEIDPVTSQIVWEHGPDGLFCEMAGGCEQLSDGTVLVSDAQAGRGLKVTRDGRIDWAMEVTTSATARRSRAEFYRMAAIPTAAVALLGSGDRPARALASSRVTCRLTATTRSTT